MAAPRHGLERKSMYLHWVLTGPEHAKETRLFGLGPLFVERFRELQRPQESAWLGRARRWPNSRAWRSWRDLRCARLGRRALGAQSDRGLVLYYQALQRGQVSSRTSSGCLGLYEDSLFLANLDEFSRWSPDH
jgi:ATP-binding cassette subfamily B protein